VELHEVPDRPQRPGVQPLRAADQARGDPRRDRGIAGGAGGLIPPCSAPRSVGCSAGRPTRRRLTASARACSAIEADPIVGRFGDLTIGVAEIDGRRWIVRERDWHGWPDPPRFAFFVLDQGEVWAGTDFDRWPSGWTWPPEWERVGIHL
jgi:hypothetical protein